MKPFTAEQVGIEILREAQRWLELSERVPNAEWHGERNAAFRALLKEAGHQPGWAYCMTAFKGWAIRGYRAVGAPEAFIDLLKTRITPSVVQTWTNLRDIVVQTRPGPGWLMLMRYGRTWKGHAGATIISGPSQFVTIEANTSAGIVSAARERDGGGTYLKPPKLLDFTPRDKGLYLLGFVPPLNSDEVAAVLERNSTPTTGKP